MESLLEATTTINRVMAIDSDLIKEHGFTVDSALLKHSVPFMWSKETSQAVLAVSHSIPFDTLFNDWNLDTPAVWWWFEGPLPFETLEIDGVSFTGVRALCFGWIMSGGKRALGCSTWCDAAGSMPYGMTITPSQTWIWDEHQTLGSMLQSSRKAYERQYGPHGRFSNIEAIGAERFMLATEGLSRFILAGMAWLGQKVLVESKGHVERHRRKAFNRATAQDLRAVRVVGLRRLERQPTEVLDGSEPTRAYSCRWTVDGHFRNQSCGTGHLDRRLIWISPFLKGNPDMPLRVSARKIYVVNR